ncbi:tetraspanin-11 [Cucumis melo var. makuwa]|uniref:Tetraspanin-11 n=2 Tax=Cucumis melo TaxID=3656 RepID=A0A5D3DXT2_CUCMM|nr:tetraspanin-11-like [Cucumis melo]TYK28381.1 tetraspanin-11 [Cucumis melo var. makuwa]
MPRLSNAVVGVLNCCTLILGLIGIAASLYFRIRGPSDCQKVIQDPLLVLGIFLFVVSLLGLVGSFCRLNFVLYLYLVVLFLLILGILAFTIFTILVTNKGVGTTVSGKGYKEYRLGDYSNWLQKYVVNRKNWDEIRSCLIDAKICESLGNNNIPQVPDEFYKKNLSPIQSGCCKPPSECGFEFKNATFWTVPKSRKGAAVAGGDCKKWSNEQLRLCYECDACKGGVLVNVRKEWRHLAIFNGCVLGIVTIVYCIGCCATRNNKAPPRYPKYSGYA